MAPVVPWYYCKLTSDGINVSAPFLNFGTFFIVVVVVVVVVVLQSRDA